MTSTDEAAKPAAPGVIARTEGPRDVPNRSRAARPRPRARFVLIAASVAAAAAAVVVVAGQLPARHPSSTAATNRAPANGQVPANTGAAGLAPLCPPHNPVLVDSATSTTKVAKPLAASAGSQLAISIEIPATRADRRIVSATLLLVPSGTGPGQRARALAQSPAMTVATNQQLVSSALPTPAGLAPGTYDLVADTVWPGPSLCGVENPAKPQFYNHSWVVLDQVVVG